MPVPLRSRRLRRYSDGIWICDRRVPYGLTRDTDAFDAGDAGRRLPQAVGDRTPPHFSIPLPSPCTPPLRFLA